MIKTYKIRDFTIDVDEESRLVGSSMPRFVEKIKSRLSGVNDDGILIKDKEQNLYFYFHDKEYVHIYDIDELRDSAKKDDLICREIGFFFWISKKIDNIEELYKEECKVE